jgi:hypothetical protein
LRVHPRNETTYYYYGTLRVRHLRNCFLCFRQLSALSLAARLIHYQNESNLSDALMFVNVGLRLLSGGSRTLNADPDIFADAGRSS